MEKELNFLIYNTPDEDVTVQAVVKDESIWLTQKAMAELFGCSADNISLHLMRFYNLDAIISVRYRVDSRKVTNFRMWATGILKEYMIKGFAMDKKVGGQ